MTKKTRSKLILGNNKGGKPNKKRTYLVRIINTKEVLEYYRTWATAKYSLLMWKRVCYQNCEVVKNER